MRVLTLRIASSSEYADTWLFLAKPRQRQKRNSNLAEFRRGVNIPFGSTARFCGCLGRGRRRVVRFGRRVVLLSLKGTVYYYGLGICICSDHSEFEAGVKCQAST